MKNNRLCTQVSLSSQMCHLFSLTDELTFVIPSKNELPTQISSALLAVVQDDCRPRLPAALRIILQHTPLSPGVDVVASLLSLWKDCETRNLRSPNGIRQPLQQVAQFFSICSVQGWSRLVFVARGGLAEVAKAALEGPQGVDQSVRVYYHSAAPMNTVRMCSGRL